MKETSFDIEERVVVNYKVKYNEEKLKELGFSSLRAYCEKNNITPFELMDDEDIVEDVSYNEIIEHLDDMGYPSYRDVSYWEEENDCR